MFKSEICVSFSERVFVVTGSEFFSTVPDAGSVQMPDNFKVDLAPALLCSAFAERYPEQPALHHNWATDCKNPDGSVSPK